MTKPSRKTRPSKKIHKQKLSTDDKSKKKFIVFVVIVILAAIPFCLGRYFELNSPDPFDSGANVYSAKHIIDGAKIGVEEIPSAALGTLLVNMLGVKLFGFNEIGPKLIQAILQAAALIFMFISMRKLFGTFAAATGVIIASIYLSAPTIAKFGNVKEQYMTAFMVMGISCFVLYQLGGRRWQAVLAGAFLSLAPLFKETGVSAICAVGFFVIAQPIFKHKNLKQTGIDILLLAAGVVIAMAPLYIWIIGWDVQTGLPYSFAWKTAAKILPAAETSEQAKAASGYLSLAKKLIPFSQQWPKVLRYYKMLILPIALAVIAIILRIIRIIIHRRKEGEDDTKLACDRFVLLFAVWWLADMAFVWISPRSYQQYYLPLNASAAMLGGYVIALYSEKFSTALHKGRWFFIAASGFVLMIVLVWPIIFGMPKSPDSGMYYGKKRRGYTQKWQQVSKVRKNQLTYPWQAVADYIRTNSRPTDKMYVWGWYTGIYVRAQRFSPTAVAFHMPRTAPAKLKETIAGILAEFENEMPKFIVDSRKRHVPMERPPYELWPTIPPGIMGLKKAALMSHDKDIIDKYDKGWAQLLRKTFDEDEALRYEILKSFREFVMKNYDLAEPTQYGTTKDGRNIVHRMFGDQRVFRLKTSQANKELQ